MSADSGGRVEALLTVNRLTVSYDGSRILRGVDLEVPPGQVVCLMGRNGVGKTTTLRSIMGLKPSEEGEVRLGGEELGSAPPEARARAGLGYVPQGRDIFPNLTVFENLKVGALAQGRDWGAGLDRVFELFPVLKQMLGRKGGVLSGGQQQQLAIGRALLTDPKVLLLDEPTEGIQPNVIDQIGDTIRLIRGKDPGQVVEADRAEKPAKTDEAAEVGKAIRELRREGRIGILLVEQYLDFCLEIGDRFYVMDRGSIVAQGPIARLDDNIVKKYLTV